MEGIHGKAEGKKGRKGERNGKGGRSIFLFEAVALNLMLLILTEYR